MNIIDKVQLKKEYPILRYFSYDHLQDDNMREMSQIISELAWKIAGRDGDFSEKNIALRKLLEVKDCAVRSVLKDDTE